MAYTRTYTIDAGPAGDTTKAAVATKLDGDLTTIFANLTTHEAMTTNAHGSGTGLIVTSAGTQTLTNKTLNGLTHTAATTGFTIAGGTTSKTLTILADMTYEEYTAASAACTGAVTVSVVWSLVRVGKVITMYIPSTQGAGVAVASFVFGTLIPEAYRPTAALRFRLSPLVDNAVGLTAPGQMLVDTDGSMTIYKHDGSNFTVTANAGCYAHCVSWIKS